MALDPKAPPHIRYNAALQQLKAEAPWIAEMADSAYAAAQAEDSPGPRRTLLAIAGSASEFAARVSAATPLG